MRSLLFLITLVLLGCETPGPIAEDGSEESKAATPQHEIFVQKSEDRPFTLTGRSLLIGTSRTSKSNCISADELNRVKKVAQARLEKNGFKITNQLRKAHTEFTLACDDFGGDRGTGTTTTKITHSSYKNGKFVTETETYNSETKWRRFSFVLVTHQFGHRQQSAFSVSVVAEDDQWDSLKPKILKQFIEQIEALELKAPADDLKMAGDPGCQPRFGFDTQPKTEDGKTVFAVTEVLPDSPAQKAGIRLGDVLLAIDSIAYAEDYALEGVYQEKSPVPVKLLRNGKAVRTSITSKVMCP